MTDAKPSFLFSQESSAANWRNAELNQDRSCAVGVGVPLVGALPSKAWP